MLDYYPWAIPSTLGLMMIGLALFKSGLLAGRGNVRHYWQLAACGACALLIQALSSWQEVILLRPV